MKKLLVLTLMICIVLVPSVLAESGHMRLLAVSDTENGRIGGIADLFLEIKPGTGRVFLETFPLTRVDTQISTRFAKEIACDFAEVDCNKYDFFYTITAESAIIAGPSAGAAVSVLTFSLITDTKIDKKVAITGTINSGGLIGPVGGVKEKAEAAAKSGFKKVLVPIVESIGDINETNQTLNISELEKQLDIEIVRVPTIDDAVYEFTGKRFNEQQNNLEISDEYKDTMKELAVQLCSRSTRLREESDLISIQKNTTRMLKENADNLSNRGKDAFEQSKYYSAASYCFGSNVEFNYVKLLVEDLTTKQILRKIRDLREQIIEFDRTIETEKIKTITDLESYMVVKERLIEATEFLDRISEGQINTTNNLRNLAYANERLNSAKSWAEFLKNEGKQFELNEKVIKAACMKKISEVEERLQYVQLYVPQSLENTRRQLANAYDDLKNKNYELCLFKASKAKANTDTILSVFGIRSDKVGEVISQKSTVVEKNLVKETENGVFPVLGYSYYEYANSLSDSDPFSSLLYLGYALELGDLDIYFQDASTAGNNLIKQKIIDPSKLLILAIGIMIGVLIAKIPLTRKKKRDHKDKTPAKSPLPGKKR